MRRSIGFLAALLIIALCAGAAWLSHGTAHVQVTTASVTSGPIVRRITATGTLQPITTVDVGTQVSGAILSLTADFNSIVRAGQIIARLDPAFYRAALGQSEAAVAQARADLDGFGTALTDAQTKLARAEQLAAAQLIPQSDLDAARIAADQAVADLNAGQANVVRAAAGVQQAKIDLDHTIIRSPIDGIVVSRQVDVGQTVAAAVQAPVLFSIAADLRRMEVQVDIDEADVGGIVEGEPADFDVESYPDERFEGRVALVRLQPVAQQTATATTSGATTAATSSVATVVSYTTIVEVANPDQRLRPGMTATVTLDGMRRTSAVRIPNSALAFRPAPDILRAVGEADTPPAIPDADKASARTVWRYDDGQFTPLVVKPGIASQQWTELVGGPLRPGDALITSAVIAP